MKRRIGIIGCGTIGAQLAKVIEKRFFEKAKLAGICDVDQDRAKRLARVLRSKPRVLKIPELIKRCDLIVEAASAGVSAKVARACISAGRDVMVMSVGGILGDPGVISLANRSRAKLYIPSGALCGIDGIKGANAAKVAEATLTTSKPPRAYEGAPYIKKKGINLSAIRKRTVLFEGTAKQAVALFPQNINVAATLALAGLGAKKTRVRITADPALKRNVHQIEARGAFGRLSARSENLPSPQNPKTSYLAVLSAVATLKEILENVRIGT